jgi:hypothetical protein
MELQQYVLRFAVGSFEELMAVVDWLQVAQLAGGQGLALEEKVEEAFERWRRDVYTAPIFDEEDLVEESPYRGEAAAAVGALGLYEYGAAAAPRAPPGPVRLNPFVHAAAPRRGPPAALNVALVNVLSRGPASPRASAPVGRPAASRRRTSMVGEHLPMYIRRQLEEVTALGAKALGAKPPAPAPAEPPAEPAEPAAPPAKPAQPPAKPAQPLASTTSPARDTPPPRASRLDNILASSQVLYANGAHPDEASASAGSGSDYDDREYILPALVSPMAGFATDSLQDLDYENLSELESQSSDDDYLFAG